jgi:hypothetical protein
MGIKEGEKVQVKWICNILNKIIADNFPNLEKELSIQVQEAPGHQTDLIKIETSLQHIIIKTTSTEDRKRILKAVRENKQIICKVNPSK